jgi:hypothetical protein
MGPLLRSAVVLSVVGSFANVAIGGCGARLASGESDGGGATADACGSQSDVPPHPGPVDGDATAAANANLDAAPRPDANPAAASDATGPKICDPQDSRTCQVATAAEGADCPATFEAAKAKFTCAGYPVGSYWLAGGCGPYLIASIDSAGFRQATQCVYDADSHALIGCGISADTAQGSCNGDAGADAADAD